MTFGDAIVAMKNGLKVFRPGWDRSKAAEPGRSLSIEKRQDPTAQGGEREVIVESVAQAAVTSPWLGLGKDGDVLADDWELRQ